MAAHNGERFVREAIDSVLAQTLTDYEFIIVDDASTESTPTILSQYHDPRIRLLRNAANLGLTRSLNLGLREARGQYIARLDDDDIAEPTRLAEQVALLEQRREVALAGSWTTEIDAAGRVVGVWEPPGHHAYLLWELARRNVIYHSTFTIRRDDLLAIGGYDDDLPCAQDHDLLARLIMSGRRIAVLPRRLVRYRRSERQITHRQGDLQLACGLRVRRRFVPWLLETEHPPPDESLEAVRRLLGYEDPRQVACIDEALTLIRALRSRVLRDADAEARRTIDRLLRAALLHQARCLLHEPADVRRSVAFARQAWRCGARPWHAAFCKWLMRAPFALACAALRPAQEHNVSQPPRASEVSP